MSHPAPSCKIERLGEKRLGLKILTDKLRLRLTRESCQILTDKEFAPALLMLFMISSATSPASSTSSTVFLYLLACQQRRWLTLLFLKPCHWFVCLPLTQHAKSLHSAEESADAQRIVQCVGTYHEPRPQKSRAALALQRQERPNSRTELGPQSGTFTLYHFTVYGKVQPYERGLGGGLETVHLTDTSHMLGFLRAR